jgi:hypothetical protein
MCQEISFRSRLESILLAFAIAALLYFLSGGMAAIKG